MQTLDNTYQDKNDWMPSQGHEIGEYHFSSPQSNHDEQPFTAIRTTVPPSNVPT